ncbi:TetR/AcrR family transcriptional regulator [Leifsonia poae]|uniref:TetR/AcrR family transcriptional regulator n=1 Tax=Leifsonia poae TaxID=110933 RepID=UPI003D67B290
MTAPADAEPTPRTEPRRYARGRARREEILDAAAALFAEQGFGGVSLREIAARAGISHPGLLRHFGSKDELLVDLLDRYESENQAWLEGRGYPDTRTASYFVELAARNASLPGYVELFTALAGEATSVAHPAHEHFRRRYARLRELSAEQLSAALGDGIVRGDLDPTAEAVRLAAAWDGLQLQSSTTERPWMCRIGWRPISRG